MLARHFQIPVAILLLAVTAAASHADPTMYDQAASNASTDGYYSWASCLTPNGTVIATGYDDFKISTATYVTAVQWHGNYAANINRSSNPIGANTASFKISFLADDGGNPGAVLSTGTVAMADCQPQNLGTLDFQYENGGSTYRIPFYSYRAVLPRPFAAAAGQKYWISIVGNTNVADTLWGWYSSGGANDGNSIQDFQGRITRQYNRSFTLEGTPSAFLTGDVAVGNGAYYLSFPNGDYFGYYSYLADPHYLYHFDLGYEYVFDANDGQSGMYLYDFKSNDFFYTSPGFPFPYLYDFKLNTTLYYYPDPANPGRYNTNGVRYFYNFATGQIITK